MSSAWQAVLTALLVLKENITDKAVSQPTTSSFKVHRIGCSHCSPAGSLRI
jgi:hypothetical protein